MRVTLTLLACVVAHGSVDSRKKSRFGPDDCVTLSRSAESGSCIITTDCNDEVDTTAFQDFEVSFLCSSNDESVPSVRHAFPGSEWAATEVYDTGVACDICEPAPDVATTATTVAPAASNTTAAATTAAAAVQHIPPPSAAFYGPSGCVATYRSKEGTCIMQTRCGSQDISTYEFGLTCVDGQGETERHLFGTESFDTEETFDTLIECKLCLGLDGEQLSAQNDTSLAADVATLQSEMKELQVAVEEIKNHIPGLGAGNGTAPAAEAAPAEDAAPVAAEGDEAAAEEEPAAEEGEAEEAGEAEEGEAEEEAAPAASLLRGQKKHAKKAVVRKHTSHAHVKKAVARKHVSHGKKHVAKKHVAKKKKHAALKHEDDLDLGIDDASLDEALSEFDAN